MISRFLPLCLLLSFQVLAFPSSTAQSFEGKWQGTRDGKVIMMIFDKKGFVTLTMDGKLVGGKNFSSEGVKLTMLYEYSEKADPHTLDFIVAYADGSMVLNRMPGIYKFVNANTLMVNMDFNGRARPRAFNDDDKNQVTLTKIR